MSTEHAAPLFGADFNAFMDFIWEDEAAARISPARFARTLVSDSEHLLHKLNLAGSSDPLQLQQYLHDAVRVLCAATDVCGNVELAIDWFANTPLPTFGNKNACTLVTDGRLEDLLKYVASLQAGFLG